jgi:2-O-methyltransferase
MNKQDIRSLIGDVENPVIFEIGSANGDDTLEFIKTFKDKNFSLFCFEPDYRNIAEFENKIFDDRVHLFEGVVSNVDGTVDFYTSTKNPHTGQEFINSSSLRRPDKGLFETWPMFIDEETCFEKTKKRSIMLDTFVRNMKIERIDFVWMDVQGAEDLVFEGGRWTFKNITRYIYTESNNENIYQGAPSLVKMMSLLPDFEVMFDFGTDALLRNRNL